MPKQPKNQDVEKKKTKTTKKVTKTTAAETKKEKKKTGSPSQYANKVKPYLSDIERYVRCGVTEGQICQYYNVGKTQWAQYKKDNPELNETLLKAKTALGVDLVNKSYDVAMGYDYEETTTQEYKDKNGNITGTKTTTYKRHAKADAGMLQFLLINRFGDQFARDPQLLELRKKALELQKSGKLPFDTEGI